MVLKDFKYSPLPSTGYIRLVTLLQGSGMPIRCRLEEHSVTELPQYDALSYTWGFEKCPHDGSKPRGTRYIMLNDLKFHVQNNLFHALMALRNGGRHGDQGLPIWIDAICINQDDDQEKSHQVGSMSLIYLSAEQVHAWLGPSCPHIQDVFGFIERRRSSVAEGPEKIHWHGIDEIGRRSYWHRAWIRQELILAKSLQVRCGDLSHDWGAFVSALRDMNSIAVEGHALASTTRVASTTRGKDSDEVVHYLYKEGLNSIFNIDDGREEAIRKGGARPYGLIQTLMKFGLAQSSDPRDRVYALLSLCNDTVGPNAFQADYSISCKRLFYALLGLHRIKSGCGCAELGGHLIKVLELDVGEMTPMILRTQPIADEISQTRNISGTNGTLVQAFLQDLLAAVESILLATDQTPPQHHHSDRLCRCFIAACGPQALGLQLCISDQMLRVDISSLALVFRPSIIGPILSGIATFTRSSEPAKQTLGVPLTCDEWSKYSSIDNIGVVNEVGWQYIPKETLVKAFDRYEVRRRLFLKRHKSEAHDVELKSSNNVVVRAIRSKDELDVMCENNNNRKQTHIGMQELSRLLGPVVRLGMPFDPQISTKPMSIELLCAVLGTGQRRLSDWHPSNMPDSICFDLGNCWKLMNAYSVTLKDVSDASTNGQVFFKDEWFDPLFEVTYTSVRRW